VNTTGTTVNLTGLAFNTQYYWRVQAVNGQTSSDWSSVWRFTTEQENLAAPTLVSPANNATKVSTSPTLSWNPVGLATYYTLEYSLIADFSQSIPILSIPSITSLTNLQRNTNYYWRVKAHNDNNLESEWSTPFKFKTSPNGRIPIEDNFAFEQDFVSLSCFPNPFSTTTRFELTVEKQGMISINLVDIFGRTVAALMNEYKKSGNYSFDFNSENLPAGVYYCRFNGGSNSGVLRLVIIR
ncbi:MAG: T9SS type A sorting domain-containing protein, partial [Ignavibacteria bacterium]|nr:T9SS type A sorting domain-containing protein [Ignavibacteria bacterium]